jgi:hypothetical protein
VTVRAAAAVAILLALPAASLAEIRPREIRFDLYAFSQDDDPAQPLRNEGLSYFGARPSAVLELSPAVTLHANGAFALISNEDAAELPASAGATVTSASSRVIAVDVSAGLEIRQPGSPWTFRPGAYYHHQVGWVSEGVDLGVERELAGGDAVLSFTVNQRVAFPKLRTWDGLDRGRDITATHSVSLGWKQNVSPAVVTNVSFQYTRADGFLGDSYNYVVLYDAGTPIAVRDEILPNKRNRFQVSGRVRWSPRTGAALGLDASAYTDDWDVRHVALEPSAAVPLPGRLRGRAWFRWSDQDGTEHFRAAPRVERKYQTQDSDLGTFTTKGGGASLAVPVGDGRWEWRVALFGLDRSDGMRAGGVDAGVVRAW